MALSITKGNLLSRAVRRTFSQDSIRKINTDLFFSNQGGQSSAITQFFRAIGGFLGWGISKLFNLGGFSLQTLFFWLVDATGAVARFDWNQTDAEIRQLQNANNLGLVALWGSVVGQGLGWLTGIGVGYGLAFICPVIGGGTLARSVAASVGREAIEELTFGVSAAIAQTVRTTATNTLLTGYLKLRKLIKSQPISVLENIFGEGAADFLKNQWGADNGPNYSLTNILNERIESIDNQALQLFIESAVDEFFDSFMESGVIIAQELDSAYAAAKATQSAKPKQVGIQITPDRDSPQESFYLQGTQSEVIQSAQQALVGAEIMFNRDIGQLVGDAAPDWYRAHPQRRQATITFKSLPGTLWRDENGVQVDKSQIKIPDIRSGTTWRDLKQWIKPYSWGKFLGKAQLDNGRTIYVHASSPLEAEQVIDRLLNLTTANLVKFNVTEEKRVHPKLIKRPRLMYPTYFNLLIRTPSTDLTGRTDLSGQTWDENKPRIPLWPEEQPEEFVPII